MIKGKKFQHIGLAYTDVEAAAKWYQEHLGFVVTGCFPGPKHNCYFMENGGAVYEIYQQDDLAPAVQGKIDHIAFDSDDIEADYRFCVEAGYEFTTNGIEDLPQFFDNGYRYFKIKSATGEEIEFGQIL